MRALAFLAALALSLAAASSHAAIAPPPDGRPIVIGQSYALDSKILGQTRRINVWLPADYAASGKTYPVLVLLDGGEDEDFHTITGLASLGAYNRAADMIVVGVAGIDRRHDFTHRSSDPEDLKLAPTSGGSDAFRRFLIEELKPYVAAHWRGSGDYGLIGESFAALFIVETFAKTPEAFDRYIAISPSLWWEHGAAGEAAISRLEHFPAGARSLYLTIGDEGGGMHEATYKLGAALKEVAPPQLRWSFAPLPDEMHSTIYHRAAQAGLRWTYPQPK